MAILPNLFLPGAMKSGTTLLAELLAQHRDVFLGPIKEPNHYCTELHASDIRRKSKIDLRFNIDTFVKNGCQGSDHFAYVESKETYTAIYTAYSGQKWILDASTTYLPSPFAAQQIAESVPSAKAIILVRDPVQRAWSEFQMNQSLGITNDDYRSALERERTDLVAGRPPLFERYVSAGNYKSQIDQFKSHLGTSNVLVLNFLELKSDRDALLEKLATFLEISCFDQCSSTSNTKQNAAKLPKYPIVNQLLARTGLKSVLQGIVPSRLKPFLRRLTYTPGQSTVPKGFIDSFQEYAGLYESSVNLSHGTISKPDLSALCTD